MKNFCITISLIVIIAIAFPHSVNAQNCDCPYPDTTQPIQKAKIFSFSNSETLSLCGGTASIKNNSIIYSGFVLRRCDYNKVIMNESDDEIESYYIKKVKDTLFVENLYGLPIGKNFSTLWVPFYIYKFSFKKFRLQQTQYYRKDIRKYNKEEIAQVLLKYKKLTRGNYEHTIDVANMLFWAYVSGSTEAEVYLNSLKENFGPFDGAIAEEWDDVVATYEHWKETNKTRTF